MPLADMFAGATERDIMKEHAIIADGGGFADNDTVAVVDKTAGADTGARMDFDPGEKAVYLRQKTRDERYFQVIQNVDEPVKKQRQESGIDNKLDIPRGGVISVYGFNIFGY